MIKVLIQHLKRKMYTYNVNGVAFEHFLKVIKNGFFVKCVVFTDSDSTKQTKNRAPILKRAFKTNSLIDIQITTRIHLKKINRLNKSGDYKNVLLDTLEKTKKKMSNNKSITNFRDL